MYSESELRLRHHAFAVSFGLIVAAFICAGMIDHVHGFYAWQVEVIFGEFIVGATLLTALWLSSRSGA